MKLLKVFKVGGACGGFKCQPKPEACAELLKKVMSLVGGWHFKSRDRKYQDRSFSEWEIMGFPFKSCSDWVFSRVL